MRIENEFEVDKKYIAPGICRNTERSWVQYKYLMLLKAANGNGKKIPVHFLAVEYKS